MGPHEVVTRRPQSLEVAFQKHIMWSKDCRLAFFYVVGFIGLTALFGSKHSTCCHLLAPAVGVAFLNHMIKRSGCASVQLHAPCGCNLEWCVVKVHRIHFKTRVCSSYLGYWWSLGYAWELSSSQRFHLALQLAFQTNCLASRKTHLATDVVSSMLDIVPFPNMNSCVFACPANVRVWGVALVSWIPFVCRVLPWASLWEWLCLCLIVVSLVPLASLFLFASLASWISMFISGVYALLSSAVWCDCAHLVSLISLVLTVPLVCHRTRSFQWFWWLRRRSLVSAAPFVWWCRGLHWFHVCYWFHVLSISVDCFQWLHGLLGFRGDHGRYVCHCIPAATSCNCRAPMQFSEPPFANPQPTNAFFELLFAILDRLRQFWHHVCGILKQSLWSNPGVELGAAARRTGRRYTPDNNLLARGSRRIGDASPTRTD